MCVRMRAPAVLRCFPRLQRRLSYVDVRWQVGRRPIETRSPVIGGYQRDTIEVMSYKRNQIEEAIARIVVPNCKELPSELRTRIKRLLELDRSMGRKVRSKYAEEANFAFFSEKAPGTGADISFSEYEAFALFNGLRIMNHGWPQSFAVSIMRRVRADLEREHARILRQDPKELFDWEAIRIEAHGRVSMCRKDVRDAQKSSQATRQLCGGLCPSAD